MRSYQQLHGKSSRLGKKMPQSRFSEAFAFVCSLCWSPNGHIGGNATRLAAASECFTVVGRAVVRKETSLLIHARTS